MITVNWTTNLAAMAAEALEKYEAYCNRHPEVSVEQKVKRDNIITAARKQIEENKKFL